MTDEFGIPKGPNSEFWFGADAAGRDLFVRTMYGARTSLVVGLVATGIAVTIGTVIGLLRGFYGRWAEQRSRAGPTSCSQCPSCSSRSASSRRAARPRKGASAG